MSKGITIADVAERAGVSMMTVSRVINNKEGVSEVTRARVRDIVQVMGFQPNGIARGLATKRTATIGLVVPDIANSFFAEIARGVEDVAYAHDFNVFLFNSSEDVAREQKALDSLSMQQVDGLIWCSSRLQQPQLLHNLERFSYVVLINRELAQPLPGVVSIAVDDEAGILQAVAHFGQQGRRQIAFMAGPAHSYSGQRRRQGFEAACAAQGVDSFWVLNCDPTGEGGYEAAMRLLVAQPTVDAILAYNDLVAVGVMQACGENGRSIPQDIAIIGIGDIPLASLVTPSLSTLRIDKYGLGSQAMDTLLQLIHANEQSHTPFQTLQPKLILRQSTSGA